jgi:glycine betaine/proline transport system substrate-binding protein
MTSLRILTAAAALSIGVSAAEAADPPACKEVRFSDVGWSCITATTSIAASILEGLGYEAKVDVLSVPVTFQSLANNDLDAFLGLWLPTQESMISPYFEKGQIEKVTVNLEGAKYTLAVPKYVEVVESSEQGMLSQVQRATKRNEWIVYLGWEPHPMNRRFAMAYLDGGDDYFGPNFGGATVYTLAPAGYVQKCPNVGKLLQNLGFTLAMENEIMGYMLDDGMDPGAAAMKLVRQNPELVDKWLAGVTTLDGKEGATAVRAHLGM